MATIDLGKIKLTWRGTYNNSTAYVVDDVVAFTDTGVISTYICVANSTGNAPSSSGTAHASWQYMTKGVALSGSANGDIPYYNGSSYVPLTAGTNGFFLKTQGAGAAPVWAALNEYNDAQVQNNIALLAFKFQTQNSLTKFGLDDQYIDEFNDQTGVDTSASSGEAFSSKGWVGLTGIRNWWGDSSDGDVTIDQNTSLTVSNKQGQYDGDMVIKNYENLTINSGFTLTTDQPCRGLFIFVNGNCTINGTLSMRERGAFANPTAVGGSDNGTVDAGGIKIPYLRAASSETLASVNLAGTGTAGVALASNFPALSSNGYVFNIDRQGANGAGNVSGSNVTGSNGAAAANKTGGGGSGGAHDSGTSGAGNYGSCFAGGSGGGGSRTGSATAAAAWAGAGGNAGSASNCSGGAGNPNGSDNSPSPGPIAGETGTGGLLGLFVRGNLTIGGSGLVTAEGSKGNSGGEGGGGNSGSGCIFVGYAGTLSNSGSITVAARAQNTVTNNGKGGLGGAGHSEIQQVDESPGTAGDMTIISNTFTANAAPSKGDFVMQYTDQAGTATLNTDLKAYISRDNGSSYTQGTLVAEGTPLGGKKLVSFHNQTLGGSATTNLKYKIETLNQSASKITKIDSVAIGWSA
tara:strand:+ start:694 stop:2589 length:1896 start_codon:yes stop_codon:yes gene_type:complete